MDSGHSLRAWGILNTKQNLGQGGNVAGNQSTRNEGPGLGTEEGAAPQAGTHSVEPPALMTAAGGGVRLPC